MRWMSGSKQMYDASLELITVVKDLKPVEAKNAAFKLNSTCIRCHR